MAGISLTALILALGGPAWGEILHVYDRVNRLRATVDTTANDSSIWQYDSVGNVMAVTRQPATQTTILEVPPDAVAGACGVRIVGIGFSPTPGQNTVTVNGVAATVQSATATELVVCLGGTTTTGSVVVTTPTGSDTSDGPLPVQAAAAVPTVTGFTPGIAVWGTALGVTGTHFDPGPGLTRVRLGATALYAPVTAVTATNLGTTVPPGATSGRLTVTTPVGTGTAPTDVFIPPAPYVASDVAITGRLTLGSSQSLTIPPLKQALLVFDGIVGQKVCVGDPFTTGYTSVVKGIFLPTGPAMFSPYSGGATVIEVSPLPMAGTYQIQLRNGSGSTTVVGTATLYDASDQLQGTIPTDGTATPVTFTTPCYRAGRTFVETPGHRVSLMTSSTVNAGTALSLVNPDGTVLTTSSVANNSSAFLEPVTLPQSGTYTLWADPNGAATGTLTFRLYDVPPDLDTPITPGGPSVTATLAVPGQQARLPFEGTAGHRVGVQIEWSTFGLAHVWVAQPDGAQIGPKQGVSPTQTPFFDTPTLPTAGTYRLVIDPAGAYTGWMTVRLYDILDVIGSLPTPGVPTSVALPTPGQQARLTFPGVAAGRISVRLSNSSGPLGNILIQLLRPDASVLATAVNFLDATTLPVTGTYTVVIDPTGTGSLDVTRYDVVDAIPSVPINGGAVPVSLATPGQNGLASVVNDTAGRLATVRITGNTVAPLGVTLKRPDGTTQVTVFSSAASFTLAQQTLAVTGTYTVVLDPQGAATGSLSVEVTSP